MFKNVTHIGIAVRDLAATKKVFRDLLGLDVHHEESVAGQQVNTAMFRVGSTSIELLEATGPDSSIARFIEKKGEGVHHISFAVDDIEKELRRLKESGFQLVDETPKSGADNYTVAFLHPKSTHGVLIEISQKK